MAIGSYEDFGSCVAVKKRDGLSEDVAKQYCGKIQQSVEESMTTLRASITDSVTLASRGAQDQMTTICTLR